MSGISVTLDRAWIGLWTAPETQLLIPRLTAMPISVAYAGTTVQFAGDDFPTAFRGESQTKSYQMTARYMKTDQDQMLDLLNLFAQAANAADSRLLLRTNAGQVAGLNDSVAVVVFGVQPTPGMGLYWDVNFTANVVQSSEDV